MIARDNESTIASALGSAMPWVDEVVVVDTGSVDRTPEIAKQFGAQVSHFEWCDNFAAARNRSLELASCDWILWIDTDDTLPPEAGEGLRALLNDKVSEDELGIVMRVRCPGPLGEHDMTDVDHIKVIRRHPGIRFDGRIHEQVLPSIRRLGGRVRWSELVVEHTNSDQSPSGRRRKLERDLRLLRLEMADKPSHPFVLFNLGMTLRFAGSLDESEQALLRCIDVSSTQESHLRKAYTLLMDVRSNQGRYREAIRTAWEGLGRFPDDAELAFKLGREHMRTGAWHEAADAFRRCQQASTSRYFASVDPGIRNYKTHANLAQCLEACMEWLQASRSWTLCLEHQPTFIDAWIGLIRCARATDDTQPLAQAEVNFASQCAGRAIASAFLATDPSLAKQLYQTALHEYPLCHAVLDECARFYQKSEDWASSLECLQALRSLEPTDPAPCFNGAVALFKLGRIDEACALAEESERLRSPHEPTARLLAELRQLQALNEVQASRVIDHDPSSSE